MLHPTLLHTYSSPRYSLLYLLKDFCRSLKKLSSYKVMKRIDVEPVKAGRRRKCVRSSGKQERGKEKRRKGEEEGSKRKGLIL